MQLKDILKEKRCRKVTKGVLFLHDNAPSHRALATQQKLAYLGFQCLDHPPSSPDLAPSEYNLFPGLKKKIEWSPFFFWRGGHCCRRDPVGRTTFWIFFSDLQKLEQRAKKYIQPREECVEYIPSFVTIAFFLPGRAKDLSAHPHIISLHCMFRVKLRSMGDTLKFASLDFLFQYIYKYLKHVRSRCWRVFVLCKCVTSNIRNENDCVLECIWGKEVVP